MLTFPAIPDSEQNRCDSPYEPVPSQGSWLWRGFKVVLIFIGDTLLRVSVFVILGIAAYFFYPLVMPPLFALAISSFVGRTVVKLIDAWNFRILLNLKERLSEFLAHYSKIQIIASIFSLALCFLTQIGGVIVASVVGIVNGVVMGIDISKKTREREINGLGDPLPFRDAIAIRV